MTQQEKLIKKLTAEQERINSREIAATILYLKHGICSDKDIQQYPMLYTAVQDFDTLYNDYCPNEQ